MSNFESQVHRAAARHAELLQILADTDYAPPALEEQWRFIDDLDSQIAVSNQKLKLLDMKREMEHKELGKFRDSQVRRFVYKAACQQNKFADRAEKGERDYSEVVQKVRQERSINTSLRDQRKEASISQRQLEVMAPDARPRAAEAGQALLFHIFRPYATVSRGRRGRAAVRPVRGRLPRRQGRLGGRVECRAAAGQGRQLDGRGARPDPRRSVLLEGRQVCRGRRLRHDGAEPRGTGRPDGGDGAVAGDAGAKGISTGQAASGGDHQQRARAARPAIRRRLCRPGLSQGA
ncbi:hypothetical protein OCS_03748 [Ophiocordyceps sinensis CO18]|uniref:Uncharacterized protein n=1 Tax=Ophiocordyceps sinensis (strain Co18 / CGMCC 3.14243) TaxID=911162 RepID=T5AD69_OPHSC|nr:hypothetical protein OCS_03748 [Ophiocordyceps sinensis CO18]